MKNGTGYKQMLRDRCPKVVDLALKWCKAKEAWLNHVYNNWIWIYSSNEERLKATRSLLGYDKNPRQFIFEDTIIWDNFSEDEEKRWKSIVRWVSWFQSKHKYIENAYFISKQSGKDILSIKYEIMNNYLDFMFPTKGDTQKERDHKNKKINELLDLLIDSFEKRI